MPHSPAGLRHESITSKGQRSPHSEGSCARQDRHDIRIQTSSSTHSFTKYCGSGFCQCSALVGLSIQHTQHLVTLQSELMDAKLEIGPGRLGLCLL